MDNILAIDASTHRTGLAWFEGGQPKYTVLESSASAVEQRIISIRNEFIEFLKQHPIIDTIIIEEVRPEDYSKDKAQNYMSNHTQKVLTWLQGCLAIASYEVNKKIKFEYIGASSWRSVIGIQGRYVKRDPQKQIDIEYANKKYGLNLTSTQDDEADALCILTAYHLNKNKLISNNAPTTNGDISTYKSAF